MGLAVSSRQVVTLAVNGREHELDLPVSRPLLDVLREDLGLTGAKECCSVGECGACTILVDGLTVNSCLMLAVEADNRQITTIEGLTPEDGLSPLQESFLEHGAVQCGFCIPGMIVSAQFLLDSNPNPTASEINEGLAGNLCRCGGYNRMLKAVEAITEPKA